MAIHGSFLATKFLRKAASLGVPKGYFAVYVGETVKKRYVVPLSYLNNPILQELLKKAEEEYDFTHPMGGLTIPFREETFFEITSHLGSF